MNQYTGAWRVKGKRKVTCGGCPRSIAAQPVTYDDSFDPPRLKCAICGASFNGFWSGGIYDKAHAEKGGAK